MDVESAMKINELAKELTKKGFASSSEDASKMAEQFLQKTLIPKENLSQPKSTDKLEIQLERIQRKFNNDLSSLQEKMNSLINKLNMICDEVKNLKTRETPVKEGAKASKEEKQNALKVKEENKESPNQRTGNFKPGDIDINEVFYCGTK